MPPSECSEVQFQGELYDSRRYRRTQDLAESCRILLIIRVGELWRIESVEQLRTKLNVGSVIRPRQNELLYEREIRIPLVWSVHNARSGVSEAGSDTVGSDHWKNRETVGI